MVRSKFASRLFPAKNANLRGRRTTSATEEERLAIRGLIRRTPFWVRVPAVITIILVGVLAATMVLGAWGGAGGHGSGGGSGGGHGSSDQMEMRDDGAAGGHGRGSGGGHGSEGESDTGTRTRGGGDHGSGGQSESADHGG
jgi:hypothetical protein